MFRLRLHGGGGGSKTSSKALSRAQQRSYELDVRRQELARREAEHKEMKEKADLASKQSMTIDRRRAIRTRANSLFDESGRFDL